MEALEARDVPAVTFGIEKLSDATEGGAAAQFRVTATGDSSDFSAPVYAIWDVTGGTATFTNDYTVSPARLSYLVFTSSGATATVTVTAVDDTDVEGDETVSVMAQRYQMYPTGPQSTYTLTIHDNDTAPVTIFSESYESDDVSVTVTVTQASPESDYVWTYHVTNESRAAGLSYFAVPVEDPAMISAPADSLGWGGTMGLPLDSCWVVWGGASVPPLALGASADFTFLTATAGIALSNALYDTNLGLDTATSPAVFVAAPIPQLGPQPPQQAPPPAVLVTTQLDQEAAGEGASSLREAINWANLQFGQNPTEIRFSKNMTGRVLLIGSLGQLPQITGDVVINGAGRTLRMDKEVPAPGVQVPGTRFFEGD
ncbi:MAG: Calx-beta domain-containing protein [Gemmataceae bacterium]